MKKIIKELRQEVLLFLYEVLYKIKPRYAADLMYYHVFHKRMNLDNPKNLIEKINWMQFNTDTSLWTLCADKYRMREYVSSCGLGEYLPQLYGHWKNPADIEFDKLPNEFVLKSNNGCGTVKIVRDKTQLDIPSTIKLLKSWIKPYGYIGGQTHYLHISPCIIAEELLHQRTDMNVAQQSLTDYKIWCFHGKPECILVIRDRVGRGYLMDMYDTNWERIPNSLKNNEHNGVTGEKIPKPVCLNKMFEIAQKLAEPFIEVRCDFYIIEDKPIIGELTFTSGYGNYTEDFYEYLGNKISLNSIMKGK